MNIQQARQAIAQAFQEDPGFRCGYQANIAMLIFDDQHPDPGSPQSRIELGLEPKIPIDLTSVIGCNLMADRILSLIFKENE